MKKFLTLIICLTIGAVDLAYLGSIAQVENWTLYVLACIATSFGFTMFGQTMGQSE